MEEPAGGPNYGRRTSTNPEGEGRHLPLDSDDWQAAEFLRGGGWTVARVKDPTTSGMHAHRGVLHEDEHVDLDAFHGMVAAELGFTLEQLHSVYSTGGRIPADRRELRGRIDARLLALSRSGANMDLFGRVSGLNASTLDRALARARDEED